MKAPTMFDTAVCVGSWQLPHLGHQAILTQALECAAKVIVVIGSAFQARSPLHPFTWRERASMLTGMLSEEQRTRVHFAAVRDYYCDIRWANAVQAAVRQHSLQDSQVAIVVSKADAASRLEMFPQWQQHTVEDDVLMPSSEQLLDVLFTAKAQASISVLEPYVPEPVLEWLRAWLQLPVAKYCRDEHLAVREYRDKYPAKAYLTADAVVTAAGKVLMVQRAGDFGRGQWALPGGHLEAQESLLDTAIRELQEETHIGLLKSQLKSHLVGQHLFDSPRRSPRGRLVTHAYFFDLGDISPPEVRPSEESLAVAWMDLRQLAQLEEHVFEDHLLIIDRFLQVLPGYAV